MTKAQEGSVATGSGYRIEFLSSDAQPFAPYHDPRTGRFYPRLPADPYSVNHYRARGLVIGSPPAGQQVLPRGEPATGAGQRIVELEAELKRLRAKQAEKQQLRLL